MLKHIAGVLSPAARGRGGVKVPHNKNTEDCKIIRMPAPDKVVLPMQQHIGAPCKPLVQVGDKVLIYGKLKNYNGTPEVDANNYIIIDL